MTITPAQLSEWKRLPHPVPVLVAELTVALERIEELEKWGKAWKKAALTKEKHDDEADIA